LTRKPKLEELLTFNFLPTAPVVESYRALRTNLRFLGVEKPIKSLVVTSPVPEEGKTLTSCNLAIATAESGQPTVLVDGDFRRMQASRMFRADNRVGLSTVLAGEAQVIEVLKETRVPNLELLTAGPRPPNPGELLGSARMTAALQELTRQGYMVIIDSPPVLAVTDPLILGAMVDGVLLVLHAGKVSYPTAQKAKAMLEQVQARLLGVVLSQASMNRRSSDYYYSSYYDYGEEPDEKEGLVRRRRGGAHAAKGPPPR
jgi:capsular exopolysaccharide synthesis family protein